MKRLAHIRIAGPDKKGIIAGVTGFLFECGCNIEDIDQRILEGYLTMNMLVDVSRPTIPLTGFERALKTRAAAIGVDADFRLKEDQRLKNVALLVSSEPHCAQHLLETLKRPAAKGRVRLVIGNHSALGPLARRYKVPFHCIPSENKKQHEDALSALLTKHGIDLIVLARYMQILSPEFVFRHEGRIINIHPSLLPAFPGPRAYHQAHNKGVDVIGVTAHFVTTDLDEGPIICQESTRVDKTRETVEAYIAKGQKLEVKALSKAVDLFLRDRLFLRRGKVLDSKKLKKLQETTRAFYT